MRTLPLLLLTLTMIGAGSTSCFNPVHADAVAALGDEKDGVRPGPEHRAGQPCIVCHGGYGPGPDFVIGGTIFKTRGGDQGLADVEITLTDATKSIYRAGPTNDVGNFWIPAKSWSPTYPVTVKIDFTGGAKPVSQAMVSPIGGNGGCAFCHYGADNEVHHMPPVFMNDR